MISTDTKETYNLPGFLSADEELLKVLPKIQGYDNTPLRSLKDTIILLQSIVPNIKQMVQAIEANYRNPKERLTQDESNSIRLYSSEWQTREHSLSYFLNKALYDEDRQKLGPWFLFLRLMLTALAELPSTSITVYRGANKNLSDKYPKDANIIWWGFSTCMKNRADIEKHFLPDKNAEKTLFIINCNSGKNIQQHSIYNDENELLLLPARQFTVVSSGNQGNGLYIVELKEIKPACCFWSEVPSTPNTLTNSFTPITLQKFISTNILCKKSFPAALSNRNLEERIAYMQYRSKVSLKSMGLTDSDMHLVSSEIITKRQCSDINLSVNNFTYDGISILARSLSGNSTLTSLIIRYNHIGEKGTQCLCDPLRRNTALTKLNLNGNEIGDRGAQHLSEALRTNTTLTTLILWDNGIGENGAQRLSEALQTNNTLTVLNLWNNCIGNRGAEHFSKAFRVNKKLAIVTFSDNRIEDAGVKALAIALETNTTLTTLNLYNNPFDIKVGFILSQKDARIRCF